MGAARHERMARRGERVERSSGAAPPRPFGGEEQAGAGSGELLDVHVENSGEGTCVICPVGELDLSTLPKLERQLFPRLGSQRGVILDLSEVYFIDSSGIGLLIQAFRATDDGSHLHTVVARGSQVERVFGLAGIHRVLPLFGSREDAIGALNDGAGG